MTNEPITDKERQAIREALEQGIDQAHWEWLRPHVQRDAVVVVDEALDLVSVGMAIAQDDVPSVQSWIGNQQIYKPTSAQLSDWNQEPNKRFNALIVQPYVLVQELSDSAAT